MLNKSSQLPSLAIRFPPDPFDIDHPIQSLSHRVPSNTFLLPQATPPTYLPRSSELPPVQHRDTHDALSRWGRNDYVPHEIRHRKRTTRAQLKILEDTYGTDKKPSGPRRKSLGDELGMTPREVQVWFQNRRAKDKLLAKKSKAAEQSSPDTPPPHEDHHHHHHQSQPQPTPLDAHRRVSAPTVVSLDPYPTLEPPPLSIRRGSLPVIPLAASHQQLSLPILPDDQRRRQFFHRPSMQFGLRTNPQQQQQQQQQQPLLLPTSRPPLLLPHISQRLYAFPPRISSIPIPGPLPAPDFSFGTGTGSCTISSSSSNSRRGDDLSMAGSLSRSAVVDEEDDLSGEGAGAGGGGGGGGGGYHNYTGLRFGSFLSIADSDVTSGSAYSQSRYGSIAGSEHLFGESTATNTTSTTTTTTTASNSTNNGWIPETPSTAHEYAGSGGSNPWPPTNFHPTSSSLPPYTTSPPQHDEQPSLPPHESSSLSPHDSSSTSSSSQHQYEPSPPLDPLSHQYDSLSLDTSAYYHQPYSNEQQPDDFDPHYLSPPFTRALSTDSPIGVLADSSYSSSNSLAAYSPSDQFHSLPNNRFSP